MLYGYSLIITVVWILINVATSINTSPGQHGPNDESLGKGRSMSSHSNEVFYTTNPSSRKGKIKEMSPQRVEYSQDDKGDIYWRCPLHSDNHNSIDSVDFEWFKLSNAIKGVVAVRGHVDRVTSVLEIQDPGPADEGRYICVSRRSTAIYFYQFIILKTKMGNIESNNNVSVYYNQKLILNCQDGNIVKNGKDTHSSSISLTERYPNPTQYLYKCLNSPKITVAISATLSSSNCSLSLLGCVLQKEPRKVANVSSCISQPTDPVNPVAVERCPGNIFLRFYYNSVKQTCLPFETDICDYDYHSFASFTECQRNCYSINEDACQARPNEGECKKHEIKWQFDYYLGKCIYGKCCVESRNRFDTIVECEKVCSKFIVSSNTTAISEDNVSSHYIKRGKGLQRTIKMNEDNPELKKDGKKRVRTKSNPHTFAPVFNISERILKKDPCFGNTLSGSCDYGLNKQNYPLVRYRFVPEFSQCHRLEYSGCNGDENLFDDSNDCKSACEYRLYNSLNTRRCQSPYSNNCVDETTAADSQHLIRYHFLSLQNKCIPFQSKNSKRCLQEFFIDIGDCDKLCRPTQATEEILQNKCFGNLVIDSTSCLLNERIHLWFYMADIKQCLQYSTCPVQLGGNVFLTKSNCDDSCLATNIYTVCSLPLDRGIGNVENKKYFFDNNNKKCRLFWYRGSLGNLNRFTSIEECNGICAKVMSEVNSHSSQASALIQQISPKNLDNQGASSTVAALNLDSSPEYCYESLKISVCTNSQRQAYITKYFYNSHRRRCEAYNYWGCGATSRNSFDSYSVCDRVCTKRIAETKSTNCSRSTSWCSNSSWIYWRYNPDRGICELFPSCTKQSANDNNLFTTVEHCTRTCLLLPPSKKDVFDVCHLDPTVLSSVNNCSLPVKRWFYNHSKEICFSSYSCPSYGNNFPTAAACQESCLPDGPQVTCQYPMDRGSCDGNSTMFYFNWQSQRCTSFDYGGCLGNRNRYSSVVDCRTMCPVKNECNLSTITNILVIILLATTVTYISTLS